MSSHSSAIASVAVYSGLKDELAKKFITKLERACNGGVMEQHILSQPDHLYGYSLALTLHQQLDSSTESVMDFDRANCLKSQPDGDPFFLLCHSFCLRNSNVTFS